MPFSHTVHSILCIQNWVTQWLNHQCVKPTLFSQRIGLYSSHDYCRDVHLMFISIWQTAVLTYHVLEQNLLKPFTLSEGGYHSNRLNSIRFELHFLYNHIFTSCSVSCHKCRSNISLTQGLRRDSNRHLPAEPFHWICAKPNWIINHQAVKTARVITSRWYRIPCHFQSTISSGIIYIHEFYSLLSTYVPPKNCWRHFW